MLIRKINLTVGNLYNEDDNSQKNCYEQVNLFTNYEETKKENEKLQKEKEIQKTIIKLKHKYGKNSIIKAMNLEEGGTTIERNKQIGGHKE